MAAADVVLSAPRTSRPLDGVFAPDAASGDRYPDMGAIGVTTPRA